MASARGLSIELMVTDSAPITPPTYLRHDEYTIEGRGQRQSFVSRSGAFEADTPERGAYAELLAIDLDDVEALLGVVNSFGGPYVAELWRTSFLWAEKLTPRYVAARRPMRTTAEDKERVSDVVFAFRAVRDFVRAWTTLNQATEPQSWELPLGLVGQQPPPIVALALLEHGLSTALPPRAPRGLAVAIDQLCDDPGLPVSIDLRVEENERLPMGAFEMLCSLLYDDIIDRGPLPRPCAWCQETFVYPIEEVSAWERRRPRTAIYCSRRCNNNAAQQRMRDRRRAERR